MCKKFSIFYLFSLWVAITPTLLGGVVGNNDFGSAFDEELYESVLDPVKCEQQLEYLMGDTSVAMRFLDVSAKIPSGVLSGNMADLGRFRDCLNLQHIDGDMEIEGKYCMMQIPLQLLAQQMESLALWPPDGTIRDMQTVDNVRSQAALLTGGGGPPKKRLMPYAQSMAMILSWGACVPKVCRPQDVINTLIHNYFPNADNVTTTELFCRLKNDKPYSAADYVALVVFTLLAVITILSTSYDLCHVFVLRTEPSEISTLGRSFSLYANTRRFLTFHSVPGALECVDGIRAISMLWIVVAHVYSNTVYMYVANPLDIANWITSFKSIWIIAAPIAVDTFFALSGVLCVYTVIGKMSRRRFLSILHLFYLNRILRIIPLLAIVVLLQASVVHRVSDGPAWPNVAHEATLCRTRWWATLLHVQNYVNPIHICLSQTWYLSVDMQLYIISPIILIWLFGRRLIAWCTLVAATLAAFGFSSYYSFNNNYPASITNAGRIGDSSGYFQNYYINTLPRAAPFIVGMGIGYVLHLCRGKKVQMKTIYVYPVWLLALGVMVFCIFIMYPVNQRDFDKQGLSNFLNAYMRGMWAMAIGWLIFACVHGYGGVVNWFLSLYMWKLPARLSYAMYLLHVPIVFITHSSYLNTYYFTDGSTMNRAMSTIGFTVLASFVLCVTVDAPCSTLQKLLLGGKKESDKQVEPRKEGEEAKA